jgi:hypothetical protein
MSVLDTPRVDTIILDETILDDTACCNYDDKPAEWLAHCRHCPSQALWCADHHDRKMLQALSHRGDWHCGSCGQRSLTWHAGFYKRPV